MRNTQRLDIQSHTKRTQTTIYLRGGSILNNEPVAWMDDCSFFTEQPDDMEGVIPLYAHPAKTLTDEEIYELFEGSYFPVNVKDSDLFFPRFDPIYFAKAILRKAQEI